jgi:hypothetical protein
MIAISKGLAGLLLLALAAAMSSGCGSTNEGPRDDRSARDVTVGGDHGVVVERSDSGTAVKVGGDQGIVVGHPRDRTEDDRR